MSLFTSSLPFSCCLQFFVFLLIIFAAEVAAGIWGLSNKEKVGDIHTLFLLLIVHFLTVGPLSFSLPSQVVTDIQDFYKQTFNNYKDTKQEALRETLRAIHYGVSVHFYGLFKP